MADVQIFREHLEKHNLVGFGGMLVSYPTKYNHHETNEVYSYEIYIDGELGTITDKIIKYFDDNGVIYSKMIKDTKSRMMKKKPSPKYNW